MVNIYSMYSWNGEWYAQVQMNKSKLHVTSCKYHKHTLLNKKALFSVDTHICTEVWWCVQEWKPLQCSCQLEGLPVSAQDSCDVMHTTAV